MLEAAEESKEKRRLDLESQPSGLDNRINDLIKERRRIKECSDLGRQERDKLRVYLGKQIQQLIRKRLEERKNTKMNHILSEFRGLQRLVNISGGSSKDQIVEVSDKDGSLHTEKEDIAEVFAKFYEDLFKSKSGKTQEHHNTGKRSIPPLLGVGIARCSKEDESR